VRGDDGAIAREKMAQRRAVPSGQDSAALTSGDGGLLSDFLGVSDPDIQIPALSPRARHARLLAIVRQLVRQPGNAETLLLLEDLHWLDEASMDFVATLVDAVVGTRMLLVLNYRPTFHAKWQAATHFQRIELTELSSEDTSHLVRELISYRRELLDICELIARRSGGNPFFAEELVRAVAETGVLSGESGASGNGIAAIERALPSNVQSVIGARIDRLQEPVKALLQICAVIGKEIPLSILERVADLATGDVAWGLDQLCAAELMQPQQDEDGPRFAFRHPLIQEVAYGMQLKARRTVLHAAVAKAMEDYYKIQGDEFAALVAHHYEAAGQAVLAAIHTGRAAQWSGRTNPAQAIKHWHKVRQLLFKQAKDIENDRLRAMASSQIALLGWREGLTLQEAQLYIEEAMNIAEVVDNRLKQLLFMVEGRLLQANGGPADGYVQKVNQALSLVAPEGDPGRVAMLNAALSHAYAWAGMLGPALAANDKAMAEIHHIDSFDRDFLGFSVEQWILGIRIRVLVRLDRLEEARACLEKMLRGSITSTDPVIKQIVHYSYVDLAWWEGDASLARVHAVRMSSIAEKHEGPYLKIFSLCCLGLADFTAGAYDNAQVTFAEALQLIRGANVAMEFETEVLSSLAESCRLVGDYKQALIWAKDAIEMSRLRSNRLSECRALITCGAIYSCDDYKNDEAAKDYYAQAIDLIQLTGAERYKSLFDRLAIGMPSFRRESSILSAGDYVH